MKEQRFILKHSIQENINGEFKISPSLNANNVKDQELFYDLFTRASGGTELNRKEIDKIIEKDWKLDYLEPEHLDDSEVEFICDYHGWISKQPDRLSGDPISKRMKKILEQFNLNTKAFYEAKVLFNNKYHDYFIWEQYTGGFDKYVDFEHSTFCEKKFGGEFGDDIVRVKNYKELMAIENEKDWFRGWLFKRAVMKPEFKEIDATILAYPYINIISERLKYALEEANITGIEIKPFHVEFEYLD